MKNSRTDTTYSITKRKTPLLAVMAAALILPLLSAILFPQPAQAAVVPGQVGWQKQATPVLPLGPAGTWDSSAAANVSVVKDGSTLKMYYSGQNLAGRFQIGVATSTDGGITWSKHPGNPVVPAGSASAWDAEGVASPAVVIDGSTYKMWFMGRDASDMTRIGYATSTDGGLTWSKRTTPVLTAQHAFEAAGVGSPAVIKDSGDFKMWYTAKVGPGFAIGELTIGLATSPDGIAWTKNGATPVFTPATAPTAAFSQRGVGVASVMRDSDNLYKMWFTGYRGMGLDGTTSQIGLATSPDGITWTPRTNPVVSTGAANAWDGRGVGSPSVIKEGGGGYKMWFSGLDSNLAATTGFARIPDVRAVHGATQVMDPTTEIIGIKHSVSSILSDGSSFNPTGGIASYSASAGYASAGINILEVTGYAPYVNPTVAYNNAGGTTTYSLNLPAGGNQAPFDVALLIPKLIGAATNRYDLTLDFTAMNAGDGSPITQQASVTIRDILRGDAAKNLNNFTTSDLTVNMTDAMFIAQFRVGIRFLETLNPLAAASVRYDYPSAGEPTLKGDKINIQDAMFIAQYRVNIRDASYVLIP
ncbi:MAG: hypothetical protein HY673_04060 [Chloroflexi bacterium]|nr:hypothetical protein [Chloroflexota bacterium]